MVCARQIRKSIGYWTGGRVDSKSAKQHPGLGRLSTGTMAVDDDDGSAVGEADGEGSGRPSSNASTGSLSAMAAIATDALLCGTHGTAFDANLSSFNTANIG